MDNDQKIFPATLAQKEKLITYNESSKIVAVSHWPNNNTIIFTGMGGQYICAGIVDTNRCINGAANLNAP